jgi:hypothetical protein
VCHGENISGLRDTEVESSLQNTEVLEDQSNLDLLPTNAPVLEDDHIASAPLEDHIASVLLTSASDERDSDMDDSDTSISSSENIIIDDSDDDTSVSSSENISVHSDVEHAPVEIPDKEHWELNLNRYTVLCQRVGSDLSVLMSQLQSSAQNVSVGVDVAMLVDDTKLGLIKESKINKFNSNEQIGLFLTEAMSTVSNASVTISNLMARLVLANNMRDQKKDPRCTLIKFSDGHFKVSFPPLVQMSSQTGPGSNVHAEFYGTRTVYL